MTEEVRSADSAVGLPLPHARRVSSSDTPRQFMTRADTACLQDPPYGWQVAGWGEDAFNASLNVLERFFFCVGINCVLVFISNQFIILFFKVAMKVFKTHLQHE